MDLATIFVWVMAAFYAIAGVGPLANMNKTSAQYVGWGYPAWWALCDRGARSGRWHVVDLSADAHGRRSPGMPDHAGCIATVLRAKEYGHAIPPVVVLALTLLIGWIG